MDENASKLKIELLKDGIENLQETAINQNNALPKLQECHESLDREFDAVMRALHEARIHAYDLEVAKEIANSKLTATQRELTRVTEHLGSAQDRSRTYEEQIMIEQRNLHQIISQHEQSMKIIGETFRKAPAIYESKNLMNEIKSIRKQAEVLDIELNEIRIKIDDIKLQFNSRTDTSVGLLDGNGPVIKRIISECNIDTVIAEKTKEEKELRERLRLFSPHI